MNNNPKYTIIIPTVNRKIEFLSTLSTVTADQYPRLEILIQDNASTWGLAKAISEINDNRITLSRSETRLEMSENWASAIGKAKGDYIFMLGDDDGWYRGSLELIDRVLEQYPSIELISWQRDDYGWPPAPPCIANRLIVNWIPQYNLLDSKEVLSNVLTSRLSHEYLPKIYSAFHKRELIARYSHDFGSLFCDKLNPDIATGLQALFCTDNFVRLALPVSIIGTSTGGGGWAMAKPVPVNYESFQVVEIDPTLDTLSKLGSTPSLSILVTFLIFCRAAGIDMPSHTPFLIRHIGDLPWNERVEAFKIITSLMNQKLYEELIIRLTEILDQGEEWIQPAMRVPRTGHVLNDASNHISYNLDASMLGIKNIKEAAETALLVRSILQNRNFQK